ncbi:MAG: hypothetical protein B6D63_02205 [Candidatus Latescibacteria bacterium 4484_7]|nr:MAG: hypothetical protein B6D63_02205 [Candidatus Latescibacteria bacterium 4484_7]
MIRFEVTVMNEEKKSSKEDRKKEKKPLDVFRESRGGVPKELTRWHTAQNKIRKKIMEGLKEEPMTVPELSKKVDLTTNTVFWHLMALKKYGFVVEVQDKGDYAEYALKEDKETSK